MIGQPGACEHSIELESRVLPHKSHMEWEKDNSPK